MARGPAGGLDRMERSDRPCPPGVRRAAQGPWPIVMGAPSETACAVALVGRGTRRRARASTVEALDLRMTLIGSGHSEYGMFNTPSKPKALVERSSRLLRAGGACACCYRRPSSTVHRCRTSNGLPQTCTGECWCQELRARQKERMGSKDCIHYTEDSCEVKRIVPAVAAGRAW